MFFLVPSSARGDYKSNRFAAFEYYSLLQIHLNILHQGSDSYPLDVVGDGAQISDFFAKKVAVNFGVFIKINR